MNTADNTNGNHQPYLRSHNTTMAYQATRLYSIRPIAPHFGVECLDFDLRTVNLQDKNFIRQLKEDLIQHRFVLFRNQHLTGQRQVEISNVLGRVESTFYKHPKSPHPDIFRVSNSEEEGCTNVGRSGWHIDGTFQRTPFLYQTMYFPSTSEGGDTHFMPLKELYESLPPAMQEYCNRLWMITGHSQAPIHPLVYKHPFNHQTTMLFHCGRPFVEGWFEDSSNKTMDASTTIHRVDTSRIIPALKIQRQLTQAIEERLADIGHVMKWEQGDFMIIDNLALAHYASDGTQECSHIVGLRVLHRTTIKGCTETIPQKEDGRKTFRLDRGSSFLSP